VLEIAEIHLDERRHREAQRWLEKLDRSQIQDSRQLYRWTDLRARIREPAPGS
jgi:hypothetical protein